MQAILAVNGFGKGTKLRSYLTELALAVAIVILWPIQLGAEPPAAPAAPATSKTTPPGPAQSTPSAPATPGAESTGANANDPDCPAGNLVKTATVRGSGTKGSVNAVRGDQLTVEGTSWSEAGQTVVLENEKSFISIDFGAPRDIKALLVQGDNNEVYLVQGSLDGETFELVWTAPAVTDNMGLRTRTIDLSPEKKVRYLRVSSKGGDGFYSVSRVQAYCQFPKIWPPKLKRPPTQYGWAAIDNDVMVGIKGWLAVAGALLLLWTAILQWAKREEVYRRTRDVLLAILGLLALGSWWNFGHFHFDHYLHVWEHYHYYMGAKYGPELRYNRLYRCTAAADLSDGQVEQVKKRKIRNLDTNELGSADEIIKDPKGICTDRFSDARWEEFRKDIRYFRGLFSQERWDESQNDHGYNATPVWAIVARILTNIGALTWDKLMYLGIIDSALLLLMWLAVWWAFGWRATCVGLIYWGYNFPARFYWNGGAFLRYDWLFWMIFGICLLKKNKPAFGGFALTYATLLRVFPGFVVAGLIAKAVYEMIAAKKFFISKENQRFAVGCIIAMAVLIPTSSWATDGLDAWKQFVENSAKHLETPLTNNMGLKTVIGYTFDTRAVNMRNDRLSDPFSEWKSARRHYYHARLPLYLAIIFIFLVLLGRAGSRGDNWEAAALSTGLIVLGSELTCYYYGFLLTYGFLWQRRRLPGALAAVLAAVTCLFPSVWGWNDDHFAAMSLSCVITVVIVVGHIALEDLDNPIPALWTRARQWLANKFAADKSA